MKMKVSKAQFKRYRRVQDSGEYNMFDPNARIMACLEKETYMEILKNYNELKAKYEGGE